jgi:EF-P beta-lysylation protein EpmB
MAEAVRDPGELLALLGLDAQDLPPLQPPGGAFPMRVPRYFVGLMRPGDRNDPLLAQVLPLAAEQETVPGYHGDPVGDLAAMTRHGMLQKYRGRALMVTTGACAVHCRYCFRRHFPYGERSALRQWRAALAAVRDQPGIGELILSGGDPLSLSDALLATLLDEAGQIPQLRRLRIHTRVPVVLPSRVTSRLTRMLSESRLPVVMVIHANHPNEITPELNVAMQRLTTTGTKLLNQSVLLKSVNDSADTLVTLSESLFDIGVLPYYLHLLDAVAGAAHFDVPLKQAEQLLDELRVGLPGYLVPRLVREVSGQPYKVPA